jgi:hypothetical protein
MSFPRLIVGSTIAGLLFSFAACGNDDPAPAAAPSGNDSGAPETSTSDGGGEGGLVSPADAPVNERFVAGTRLHPKLVVSAEGERGLRGWYDSLMGVDCSFRLAMDGTLRCLPKTLGTNDWDRGFVAGTCNGAALLVDKRDASAKDACPNEKYFVSPDESVCPPRYRVEPIGAAVVASSYYYQESSCLESSAINYQLYELGTESAPTEWVKGTLANEPARDGLSASFVAGEDGSLGFFGWVDAKHADAPCGFSQAADGESRCLPFDNWGIVWEDLYTDPSCTSFAAAGLYSKCQSGFGRRYDDRGSCNPKYSVHPIVAPYGGGEVYRGEPGSCVGQPVGGDDGYYTTGPEIPAAEFSSLKVGDRVGTTRLKRSRSTTSGGWITGGGFYDSVRDEACSFTTAKDGKLHCMPTGPLPVGYYFADAQCTVPLYRVYEQCGSVVPKYGRDADLTTCPPRQHLFAMGARHTGAVYEKYGQGPCTQDDGTADQLILHVRAAEVEPSELVEGSELIP